MLFTLLLFALASLARAFATNYESLLSLRFVQGIGLGGEVPLMAAYVNEFAKAQNRGRFSVSIQVLTTSGFFFGFSLLSLATYTAIRRIRALGGGVASAWQRGASMVGTTLVGFILPTGASSRIRDVRIIRADGRHGRKLLASRKQVLEQLSPV
jgi:MFS family permease